MDSILCTVIIIIIIESSVQGVAAIEREGCDVAEDITCGGRIDGQGGITTHDYK